MKQLKFLIVAITIITLLAGCTKTCKIEGCKEDIYKEGLCQKHYYVNQGADAIDGAVKGITDIFK